MATVVCDGFTLLEIAVDIAGNLDIATADIGIGVLVKTPDGCLIADDLLPGVSLLQTILRNWSSGSGCLKL